MSKPKIKPVFNIYWKNEFMIELKTKKVSTAYVELLNSSVPKPYAVNREIIEIPKHALPIGYGSGGRPIPIKS